MDKLRPAVHLQHCQAAKENGSTDYLRLTRVLKSKRIIDRKNNAEKKRSKIVSCLKRCSYLIVMTDLKKLSKKATRFNKREVLNSKSVERKFGK